MIELRLLGGLELRRSDGHRLDTVLTQPKRVALLAFLAAAPRHRFHRRDTLLALFWPELDQEHARAALRQGLHSLRRALHADVLASRGDEEVGIDETELWCDARAFDQALEDGDLDGALTLYRGGLLEGFFLSGSPEFERWLEGERSRLRDRACHGAWALAEQSKAQGDFKVAAQWARRAASLVPDDEELLRRLIGLLDELGDRAGAMQIYDDFARRVDREYQVEPAVETKALIGAVRSRATASKPSPAPPEAPPVVAPTPSPRPSATLEPRPPDAAGAPLRHQRVRRFGWVMLCAGLAGLGGLAVVGHRLAGRPSGQLSVGIADFANRSGDSLDAYLATTLTEDVTRLFSASRAVHVFRTHGNPAGADYLVSGGIRRAGDTLAVTVELTRTSSGEVVWATRLERPARDARVIPDLLATQTLTALGVTSVRNTNSMLRADPAAYDLYLRGRYEIPRRIPGALGGAVALLSESVRDDSGFAPSWAALGRALHFANRLGVALPGIPRDSLLAREVAASNRALQLDTTDVDVWLTRALVAEDVDPSTRAPSLRAIRRALALDSSHAEAWHRLALALEEIGDRDGAAAAWRRAVALDPGYLEAMAFLAIHYWWWHVYDSAAAWADSAVVTDPTYLLGRVTAGQVALERGRNDEAESQLSAALRLAHPENAGLSGLVTLAVAAGDAARAGQLLREVESRTDSMHPDVHNAVNLAAGYLILGNVDQALTWLERYTPVRDLHFQLHLRLDPPLDRLRPEPRFQALLVRSP